MIGLLFSRFCEHLFGGDVKNEFGDLKNSENILICMCRVQAAELTISTFLPLHSYALYF